MTTTSPRPAPAGPSAPNPAGRRVPRGVHPAVWALYDALEGARRRLPYATAEARLVDGLARWVRLECTAPAGGTPLAPVGARWAAVLTAVSAVARLVSPSTAALLAPWAAGAGPVGAAGVSPHAAAAAGFAGGAGVAVDDPADVG